jgi:hypothetical protein
MVKKMRMEAELSSARGRRVPWSMWRRCILATFVQSLYSRVAAICLPHVVLVGQILWRNDDLDESRDIPSKKYRFARQSGLETLKIVEEESLVMMLRRQRRHSKS